MALPEHTQLSHDSQPPPPAPAPYQTAQILPLLKCFSSWCFLPNKLRIESKRIPPTLRPCLVWPSFTLPTAFLPQGLRAD